MKIIDTVPYFLHNYKPSISFLREYYGKYPDIFKEYFSGHCKDTEERHLQSIEKYPGTFESIKQVHHHIEPIIEEVVTSYEQQYDISFPIEVNYIVGGFGSNAYTYKQIIPNITFALEKLSPELNHLRVIVAHEFGHCAQNILSDRAGMDWSTAKWTEPLIWLYREGIATYLSKQIVPGLDPAIYLSYGNLDCLEELHAQPIKKFKQAFLKDYERLDRSELFFEWFSMNGGTTFGHSRLAYLLGTQFVEDYIEKHGERAAILAWMEPGFEDKVKGWLYE